jgi:S1-C subfamily serine protease
MKKLFNLILISLMGVVISGCDVSPNAKSEKNISLGIENLKDDVRIIYEKIQKKDKEKIRELIELAESGDSDANKLLGFIYLQGKFVKKNITQGIEKFRISADAGDREAALILYKIYTSSKYINDYKDDARKYGELSGSIKPSKISHEKLIKDLTTSINLNKWREVKSLEGYKIIGNGSAVAINKDGVFLTNKHVVESCNNIVVRYNDMFSFGKSVRLARDADVAVVQVEGKTPAYTKIYPSRPALGEKIYVGGFPLVSQLGADLKITDGLISGAQPKDATLIQISASVSSGNSGGPVVDEKNRLMGIATMGMISGRASDGVRGHGINFATHSEVIVEFLSRNGITFDRKITGEEYSSKELADFMKLSTGLIICLE